MALRDRRVVAARTASSLMEAAGRSVFGTMRSRVASHLLDMACSTHGDLIVRASQWAVADSVGSVRDVVARVMNELRREGIITRTTEGWLVLDAAGLHRAADGHLIDRLEQAL